MLSSSRQRAALAVVVFAVCAPALPVQAQAQAQGFSVERLYPSAPGAGWLVMDALDLRGGLGGALALTLGYAHGSLRVGPESLAVVTHQAIADFGMAITYDRFRVSFNTTMPLATSGTSGTVGDSGFVAPSVNLASTPDTLSDYVLGFDARIFGDPGGRFRLGAGAQLIIPNGRLADYDTDGTFRAIGRVLVAGDEGLFTYAAHLGVHVRPRDDGRGSGGPRGSELLFGVAAGARLAVAQGWAVVVGPELFGQTAFRSLFGADTTGLEALLSGRLEGTGEGAQLRVRVGVGVGLDPSFGTPQWRVLVGAELFGRAAMGSR